MILELEGEFLFFFFINSGDVSKVYSVGKKLSLGKKNVG